jgi:hypothetical protein
MRYNIRDFKGRFTVRNPRQPLIVRRNCIYGYKGAAVRVLSVSSDNSTAVIGLHKALTGIVPVKDLHKVGKSEVKQYLAHAR